MGRALPTKRFWACSRWSKNVKSSRAFSALKRVHWFPACVKSLKKDIVMNRPGEMGSRGLLLACTIGLLLGSTMGGAVLGGVGEEVPPQRRPAGEHQPLGHNNNSNNKIITIPLIPHRVVQQRKLQQQGQTDRTFLKKMERPKYSKYDNRFLAEQAATPKTAEQVAGLYQGYGTVRHIKQKQKWNANLFVVAVLLLSSFYDSDSRLHEIVCHDWFCGVLPIHSITPTCGAAVQHHNDKR
jgi:hypothetical protein